MRRRPDPTLRRGSTMILVLWTIGLTTLFVVSLQMSAFRQAAAGREALGRVRAKWAARAGIESVIAYLAWDTQNTTKADPVQLRNALEDRAIDELALSREALPLATFEIRHSDFNGDRIDGPLDTHTKFNINLVTQEMLLAMDLDGMNPEIANGILDWIDMDSEVRDGGAEEGYYLQASSPYSPRNGLIRTLEELDLVRDVDPEWVRGEDWNLNNALDPNESDDDLTWPEDNGDGYLDAGWSAYLTAMSRESGYSMASGEPRIDLVTAEPNEIQERLQVNANQAAALQAWAQGAGAKLGDLITLQLSQIGPDGQPVANQQGQPTSGETGGGRLGGGGGFGGSGSGGAGGAGAAQPTLGASDLTDEQLRIVLEEAVIGPPEGIRAGKLNVNTASRELLEYLPGIEPEVADQIEFTRQSLPHGYESLLDLLQVRGIDRELLVELSTYVDVRSHVYQITSRGVGLPGRTEVELVVTIDRSALPIRILEYFER
ncbi:MAG: helix-hairpin-helix domain-containing protein [Phycisphaerales bacterium]